MRRFKRCSRIGVEKERETPRGIPYETGHRPDGDHHTNRTRTAKQERSIRVARDDLPARTGAYRGDAECTEPGLLPRRSAEEPARMSRPKPMVSPWPPWRPHGCTDADAGLVRGRVGPLEEHATVLRLSLLPLLAGSSLVRRPGGLGKDPARAERRAAALAAIDKDQGSCPFRPGLRIKGGGIRPWKTWRRTRRRARCRLPHGVRPYARALHRAREPAPRPSRRRSECRRPACVPH